MTYTNFDYLFSQPYYVEGIGILKATTIDDIRSVTFLKFQKYVSMLVLTKPEILSEYSMQDAYYALTPEQQEAITPYNFYTTWERDLFKEMIEFFIVGHVIYDDYDSVFLIGDEDGTVIGQVEERNYELFCDAVLKTLGIEIEDKKPKKFKNKKAQELYEQIEAKKQDLSRDSTDNDLDNLIIKYCTYNSVGINILNVGQLTYRTFFALYQELCLQKAEAVSDAIYAHTVTYEKVDDYHADAWKKNIKTITKDTL